jgi:glycyl-tRNA synthetase beta chain
MAEFLFEIGIEEVPVSEIKNIIQQLQEKFQIHLKEKLIDFKTIETAATNRRFMVHISGISETIADKEKQILGPARNIAYDKDGNPTIILNKFLAANKIQLDDIKEVETKKGIYIGAKSIIPGNDTTEILPAIITDILKNLSFSQTMIWNESRISFIRPIKNILALFNNQLIECEFAGIKSSNLITGHNLLSREDIELNSFKDYFENLNKNFVMVREDERREKILNEIKDIEEELQAKIEINSELLEYYIYNNEYPVVFIGEFDKKYLELPAEIISTFMIHEKKLHPISDKNGQLTNHFFGVSNIPDENRFVADGNEKVIQATFEDAKFFWEKDRKDDFLSLREKLKKVMFQKDLGTFYDKTERVAKLADFLAKETKNFHLEGKINQAAFQCKNDLVTRMVREFPSLQGIMGGLYLKESGTDQETWESVYGHYKPKGFSDEKLSNLGAGILSIADKIDNIAGFIAKGIKTSSSKDPFGIRRDANAIIKIIIDFKLHFDLNNLLDSAAEQFTEKGAYKNITISTDELKKKLKEFFLSRIENIFKDFLNIRYDLINSILETEVLFIYKTYLKSTEISSIIETESISHLIILHKRLKNIIKDFVPFPFSEKHLKENEEKILFEIFKESKAKIEDLILKNNYVQACSKIMEMKPIIDNFFDNVLVMVKEKKIKENRIALLQKFDEILSKIANFSLIVE